MAQETIRLAEQNGLQGTVPTVYSRLITYLYSYSYIERSAEELGKLRDFHLKTGLGSEELYTSWQNVLVAFFEASNPLRAMSEFHDMEALATELNDNFGLACAYASLGCISEYAYEAGIENFNLALKYLRLANRLDREYDIYYRMADLSYNGKLPEEALRYIDMMLNVDEKPEGLEFYADYLKLGAYLDLNNQAEAKQMFDHIEQLWDSNEIPTDFMSNYAVTVCKYLCKYGNPDEVLKYIDFVERPDEKLQAQITYHKVKGNYKAALELTEKYDTIQMQKMTESQQAKVVNANTFYQNKELAARNLALEIAHTKSRNFMLFAALCLVVIIAAAITYTIRRHNKILKKERDHTEEQRRIAEELRSIAEEERKNAVSLSEMKTTFINNMSYEVRTPLTSIIGFNDLLNDSNYSFTPEERKEMLDTIHTKSKSLLALLNNVIYLSRIDGHDIKPHIEQVSLSEILNLAAEFFKDKLVPPTTLEIRNPELADRMLDTDRDLLMTAIKSVLDNSLKFGKGAPIVVEAIPTGLAIANHGDPIPAEAAETIFDRFEKLGRYDAGFGLGLSIARESLALIGGTIHLDTTYHEGTRFIITL